MIPLRSQVEKALEEPPRLASCAYQGAWNTTGTVTYSDVQLDHRCPMQIRQVPRLTSCGSGSGTCLNADTNQPRMIFVVILPFHSVLDRTGEEGGELNRTSGVFTALTPGVFTFVISGFPSAKFSSLPSWLSSGWVWMENARLPREGDNACLHLWLNDGKVRR